MDVILLKLKLYLFSHFINVFNFNNKCKKYILLIVFIVALVTKGVKMKKNNAAEAKFNVNSKKTEQYNAELANIIYNYKNIITYAPSDNAIKNKTV